MALSVTPSPSERPEDGAVHQQIATMDGTSFRLPSRHSSVVPGRLSLGCLVPFGLVFGGAPLTAVLATAGGGSAGWLARIISLLITLPLLAIGLFIALLGLGLYWGRSEIEIGRGRLSVVARLGPLRWTRSRPLDGLERLVVERSGGDASDREPTVLTATFRDGRSMHLAAGYPRASLLALARDISVHCAHAGGAKLLHVADDAPAVVEEDLSAAPVRPPSTGTRPAETLVVVEQHGDGVTVRVPPAGLWRGSKGLFSFAVLSCGFALVFSAVTVIGPLLSVGTWAAIPFILGSGFLWIIGLLMLVAAINMGRRQVIIDVVGESLLITRRSIFGISQNEWGPGEIEDVRVGPSGMTIDEVPVLELQVHSKQGGRTGLLSQCRDEELYWVAGVVGAALGIAGGAPSGQKSPPATDPSDESRGPHGSPP